MKAALEGLPEAFRMAVLLADVEGFSYKEIAEITEVPIGTVMSRIHRGRRALQKALHDVAEARGLVGSMPGGPANERGRVRASRTKRRESRCGPGLEAADLFGVSVDCVEAVHELYHYLDGELTEERREEIRVASRLVRPLRRAPPTSRRSCASVIANRCQDRVPQTLMDRIAAAIDEESRQHHGEH